MYMCIVHEPFQWTGGTPSLPARGRLSERGASAAFVVDIPFTVVAGDDRVPFSLIFFGALAKIDIYGAARGEQMSHAYVVLYYTPKTGTPTGQCSQDMRASCCFVCTIGEKARHRRADLMRFVPRERESSLPLLITEKTNKWVFCTIRSEKAFLSIFFDVHRLCACTVHESALSFADKESEGQSGYLQD